MSQSLTLARPYARAAFALARDAGQLPQWADALAFSTRVAADPRVSALLGHPALSAEQAVSLLVPQTADGKFADFLALLAENRRLPQLAEIAGLYAQLRAEAEHVTQASVTSAKELSDADEATLVAALERRFGGKVQLACATDESLIGGAVIAVGDVVIDGSLKGKLARLESALIH